MTTRHNPDSEPNASMTRDNERAVFAAQMQGHRDGHYILPAIPPYCSEKRTRATLIRELPGGRVLLRDNEMFAKGVDYMIETDSSSFEPDPKS